METPVIETPIIVRDESGDLEIIESISHAEICFEAIDAIEDLFVAYDSKGRLLRMIPCVPHNSNGRLLGFIIAGPVKFELAETEPNHASELKQALVEYLGIVGVSRKWLVKASLEELVAKSLDYKTSPDDFCEPGELITDAWNALIKYIFH